MDGRTNRWMDRLTNGRTDPLIQMLIEMQDASKDFAYIVKLPSFNDWVTHGRTDGWTNGWMDRQDASKKWKNPIINQAMPVSA